jgi:hypothetical protein
MKRMGLLCIINDFVRLDALSLSLHRPAISIVFLVSLYLSLGLPRAFALNFCLQHVFLVTQSYPLSYNLSTPIIILSLSGGIPPFVLQTTSFPFDHACQFMLHVIVCKYFRRSSAPSLLSPRTPPVIASLFL